MNKEHFYVSIFLKDGVPTGHATSESNDLETFEPATEEATSLSGFGEQFDLFKSAMLGYLELLPVVASLLPTVSRGVQNSIGDEFLQSHGKEIFSSDDRKVFELPIGHRHEWAVLNEHLAASRLVGKQVPKMLLIGIVSTFEHYQSRLFSEILQCKPQKYLLDDRTVTLADVTKYASIDELKKNILERDVENIMRESFLMQIGKLEGLLEIRDPIPKSYKDWKELIEIFERRNLFAHADGRVNEVYLGRLKKESIASQALYGEELIVKPTYLRRALTLICEFGAMAHQVAWRKCCPEETEAADEALGELGYDLIERGHLAAAERILKFAKSLRGRNTTEQTLSDTINLANCYRLQKKKSDCEAELNLQNWKVLGPEYQICVASIKGDVAEVVRLMKALHASSSDFSIDNYERWAAFYGTRDHDDFKVGFKATFGRDYIPAPSLKSAISYIAKAATKQGSKANGDVEASKN